MECTHPLVRALSPGACLLCAQDQEVEAPPVDEAFIFAELDRVRAEQCRRSLATFVQQAWESVNPGTPLEWGPHIEAICYHIQHQLEDRGRAAVDKSFIMRASNVAINVPPRSLKTTCLTLATVWAWLHWPTMRIAYLSANPRVAQNSARAARDVILSHWFQRLFRPAWKIREDQDALSSFGNTAGGSRASRGLSSIVVGEGFEWLILDDPHDSSATPEQVATDVADYDSSVANRINDPRASIRTLIMQRLRENDMSGHVLESGRWMHVRLPMRYEVTTECHCGTCVGENAYGWQDWRSEEGEVLHPRFTDDFLAGEKQRLLEFGWAGQMQQRPAPAGGGIFKHEWFKWVEPDQVPKLQQTMVFCDLTFGGEKKGTSRNCLLVAGRTKLHRYVLDIVLAPMDVVTIKREIRRLHAAYPQAGFVVEAKAVGPSVVAELRQEIPGMVEYDPGSRNKEARAMSAQPLVAGGNVALLKGAPWADEFLHEVCTFPASRYNDQVDCLSMLVDYWRAGVTNADRKALWR